MMPNTKIRTINGYHFFFFSDVNPSILQMAWQRLVEGSGDKRIDRVFDNGRYVFVCTREFNDDNPLKSIKAKHACVDISIAGDRLLSGGCQLIFINHGNGQIEVGQWLVDEDTTEPKDALHLTDDELRRILAQLSQSK